MYRNTIGLNDMLVFGDYHGDIGESGNRTKSIIAGSSSPASDRSNPSTTTLRARKLRKKYAALMKDSSMLAE